MNFNNYERNEPKIMGMIDGLLTEIKRLEASIDEKIEPIRQRLDEQKENSFVIKYGLNGYREKIIKSYQTQQPYGIQNYLKQTIQDESEIRYPHRKILEFLSSMYDNNCKKFQESNFSTIVKECKLGKNKASDYLKLLEEKGLIQRRYDGYRKWFMLCKQPTSSSSI